MTKSTPRQNKHYKVRRKGLAECGRERKENRGQRGVRENKRRIQREEKKRKKKEVPANKVISIIYVISDHLYLLHVLRD